jgi:hypothetical protein
MEEVEVVELSISKKEEMANKTDFVGDKIRDQIIDYTKDFKRSWLNLGRHLYAVWQDKIFYNWGYNKFEEYTEKELGLKRSICIKLCKAYLFLEENEPSYLSENFSSEREPVKVPSMEAIDVLRLAKTKKEITKDDYRKFKSDIFEKGKDASEVRKELTAIIKERKEVDTDEERDRRNMASIRKLFFALNTFKKDMETLKLISPDILERAKKLMQELEKEMEIERI